jgi:hypothetical protein
MQSVCIRNRHRPSHARSWPIQASKPLWPQTPSSALPPAGDALLTGEGLAASARWLGRERAPLEELEEEEEGGDSGGEVGRGSGLGRTRTGRAVLRACKRLRLPRSGRRRMLVVALHRHTPAS